MELILANLFLKTFPSRIIFWLLLLIDRYSTPKLDNVLYRNPRIWTHHSTAGEFQAALIFKFNKVILFYFFKEWKYSVTERDYIGHYSTYSLSRAHKISNKLPYNKMYVQLSHSLSFHLFYISEWRKAKRKEGEKENIHLSSGDLFWYATL